MTRVWSTEEPCAALEDWRWHVTLSGAPPGGVASPILSHIDRDRLDQFVEQQRLPEDNHGRRRRRNPI
jgi:hypothetical protein